MRVGINHFSVDDGLCVSICGFYTTVVVRVCVSRFAGTAGHGNGSLVRFMMACVHVMISAAMTNVGHHSVCYVAVFAIISMGIV